MQPLLFLCFMFFLNKVLLLAVSQLKNSDFSIITLRTPLTNFLSSSFFDLGCEPVAEILRDEGAIDNIVSFCFK